MENTCNSREAFKLLYRQARYLRRKRQFERTYWLVEAAEDRLIRNKGYDYRDILAVSSAVLWAMHWRFFKPENNPPLGLSERHYGFSAGPDYFESFFSRAKLP